jgi:DNA polymerase-3 subunit epsilon
MGLARLGETPFVVIDLETTGVYTGGHDRVIEVAALRVTPDGRIEEEYATLVNPRRDIGRADIHGITAGQLQHAPDFAEVAGDVGDRLNGGIVVGHNLRFDLGFLRSEFARLGVTLPAFPCLCTMHLAYRASESPSRRLSDCCAAVGIAHDDPHTALGDAYATAALVAHYVGAAHRAGACTLCDLGCEEETMPEPTWHPFTPSGRAVRRQEAAAKQTETRGYLSQLVARLPGTEGTSAREAEYLCLLDRVLEDRVLTPDESQSLFAAAEEWGMGRNDVDGAHQAYLWALARQAKADGVVTDVERHDLVTVCELLGVSRRTLEQILDAPATASTAGNGPMLLAGKSVCFTGELLECIGGERVTRERAEELARRGGMLVQKGVTKSLDFLVVADPDTQSSKAKKARDYGTRIMAEAAFWKALGL